MSNFLNPFDEGVCDFMGNGLGTTQDSVDDTLDTTRYNVRDDVLDVRRDLVEFTRKVVENVRDYTLFGAF